MVWIRVVRDGQRTTISATDIVPGDVVCLDRGIAHCDMIILQGDNIIVDESALTGEATPVTKEAIDQTKCDATYQQNEHARNTISAGSEILELQKGSTALVLATGPLTSKGELLADVFSFHQQKFHFSDEACVVVLSLLIEVSVLMIIVLMWLREEWVYAYFSGKTPRMMFQETSNVPGSLLALQLCS
jgi:P-type Ca2+ transporter type 2C